MKICFFYEGLRPGGVERMIANLSHELIARGHSLTLVLAGSPSVDDYEVAAGTEVTWLRHPKSSARASVRRLAGQLRANDFDILLSAMPPFNNAAVLARLISGTKVKNVLTERTNPYPDYAAESFRQKAWHRLCSVLYPRADAIIAVSKGLADSLSSFAKIPRESIDVIYNPAFFPKDYSDAEEGALIHPWIKEHDGPVLVNAGRMYPQKDFPTFLRAMAKARAALPGLRAVILGDGPIRPELEALRSELGLNDVVDLPGFYADVKPSMQASGFFVLSSAWEGFGNVLVEALGAGCSIVTTDCPYGPNEIVEGGQYGLLVPVGDENAMAEGILSMISSPSDKSKQISRAEQFSVPAACDQYEAIFSRVLSEQGRKGFTVSGQSRQENQRAA